MTELQALKIADKMFMELPASTIAGFKKGVNSLEVGERYFEIVKVYEQGFIDAIKVIKENEECQKKQKTKKQLQENS